MVSAYFADMNQVLSKLHEALVAGGRIYMVVGDSQYAGNGCLSRALSTSLHWQGDFRLPRRSLSAQCARRHSRGGVNS